MARFHFEKGRVRVQNKGSLLAFVSPSPRSERDVSSGGSAWLVNDSSLRGRNWHAGHQRRNRTPANRERRTRAHGDGGSQNNSARRLR
jgi:hypothetical protein